MSINTKQELVERLKVALQGKTFKGTAMLYLFNLIFLVLLSLPLTLTFGGDWVRQTAPYQVALIIIGEYLFCWLLLRRERIKKKRKRPPSTINFLYQPFKILDTVPKALSALILLVFVGTVFYLLLPSLLEIQVREESGFTQVFYKPTVSFQSQYPQAEVWAVIHPKDTNWYFVRHTIFVNGRYTFVIRLEELPEINTERPIEGMFVANPTTPLYDGELLSSWPQARSQSNILMLRVNKTKSR